MKFFIKHAGIVLLGMFLILSSPAVFGTNHGMTEEKPDVSVKVTEGSVIPVTDSMSITVRKISPSRSTSREGEGHVSLYMNHERYSTTEGLYTGSDLLRISGIKVKLREVQEGKAILDFSVEQPQAVGATGNSILGKFGEITIGARVTPVTQEREVHRTATKKKSVKIDGRNDFAIINQDFIGHTVLRCNGDERNAKLGCKSASSAPRQSPYTP